MNDQITIMYRLLHKPTGLFFKPTGDSNSNLSKTGKIYHHKSFLERWLKWHKKIAISYKGEYIKKEFRYNFIQREVDISEFEIVEYRLKIV